jgi:MarR family transcriptional regulator, organic hydroperoxide resistance regulator
MATIPTDAELLLLDEQFCFPIYAASHLLQRTYRPLLEPLGLTYPQYLVMLVLWERDDVPVKELTRRLLLDSGTLSPLLRRLEAQDLVEKLADAGDARRVRVVLTAQGRALQKQAQAVPYTLICRLLQEGGTDAAVQLGQLRSQLRELVSALNESLRAQSASPTSANEDMS